MTSKTRIAVLVAALFLGAQAGIAALNQEAAEATAEAAETTEAVETAEAATTESAAAEAPEATADAESAIEAPAPVRVNLDSDTFPRTASVSDLLPGMIAYLEQREAAIRHLVARGDAFPTSSESPMLPALAAYLERQEAQLIARLQQEEMQAAAATPVALTAQPATRSN